MSRFITLFIILIIFYTTGNAQLITDSKQRLKTAKKNIKKSNKNNSISSKKYQISGASKSAIRYSDKNLRWVNTSSLKKINYSDIKPKVHHTRSSKSKYTNFSSDKNLRLVNTSSLKKIKYSDIKPKIHYAPSPKLKYTIFSDAKLLTVTRKMPSKANIHSYTLYRGNMKIQSKMKGKQHPSSNYHFAKQFNSPQIRKLLKNWNIFWVSTHKKKHQSKSIAKKPQKSSFDKKERVIWNN